MSFFNTLQQYVSNSVANLNISPRRFASGGQRQDSTSSNTEELTAAASGGGSFKAHSASTSSSETETGSAPAPPSQHLPPRSPLMRQYVTQNAAVHHPPPPPPPQQQRHHHLTMQERSTSLRSAPVGGGQLQHHNSAPGIKRSGAVGAASRTGSLKELPSNSNNSNSLFCPPSSSASGGNGTGHSTPPVSPHNNRRRAPKLLPTFAIQRNAAAAAAASTSGGTSSPTTSSSSSSSAVAGLTTRRTSWPQFAITGSGVQESDGSFFESYTALCWKQENRRLQVLRSEDQQQQQDHTMQQPSPSPPLADHSLTKPTVKEMEQLYVEVLYTIRHKLGAHSAQYPHHYKEDLAHYAQQAFGVGQDFHYRCHAIASEEKPPIIVLNVMVIEAEGLEAKDPNGFSDPYCMLGIQPGTKQNEQSPTPSGANDDDSADGAGAGGSGATGGGGRRDSLINLAQLERLKKHSSFRLSFKRKEGGDYRMSSSSASSGSVASSASSSSGSSSLSANCAGSHPHNQREQRDSLHAALPAKFIRATSVKNATLNPKWNEKFRFDIDDVHSDLLHLDIWDHDDEYSVLDAVSKLNEVRGVKGLGRFFKQIAQSARSNGNQDDFLGCVNIPLQEIPSTGVESWYKLGGRSQRSTIQGRIHLKLWLSTREDFGTSEEDNWTELKQQEKLYCTFIDYEVSRFKNSATTQWSGELSQTALTILHQHAIQGDVTTLQSQVVRWISYARKLQEKDLHFSVLYRVLTDLDRTWNTSSEPLSRDEEDALAESFTSFIDYTLSCIRRMRSLFGPARHSSSSKLDYLLRCLTLLDTMRAFRRCCPFHKEIRGEIVAAVRKGAAEWVANELHRCVPGDAGANLSAHINGLTTLTNRVYADLTRSHQLYDDTFQKICGISYFVIVYKSHMKAMLHEYGCRLDTLRHCFAVVNSNANNGGGIGGNSSNGTDSSSTEMNVLLPVFELNIALQDLQKFQDHIPAEELASTIGGSGGVSVGQQMQPLQQTVMALTCHECFRSVLESWLITARTKALNRIRCAVELDAFTNVEPYLKHSTSAIDATSCFYQICDFWKQLSWPDLISSYAFVYSIVEMITASGIVYADLIYLRVQSGGFFGDDWRMTAAVTDQVYVNMNNLQHVKNAISTLPQTLKLANIICAVDGLTTTGGGNTNSSSNNGSAIDAQRSPSSGRSRSASIVSGSCTGSNQLSHLTATSAACSSNAVGGNCYENSARQAFSALLDTVREHYENKLLRIAGCLADKMRNELKKNIFHLAWSPDSLPATEAAAPLIDCLDNILLDLEPHLLPAAFERCVAALWDVLLVELWSQAQASSGGDKFCKFYDRLYVALQMLVQFLHADGKGLPLDGLKGPTYQRVEEKIALHKTRTDLLIDQYHLGRLEQQRQVLMLQHAAGCTDAESAPYGVLSVRVYFHHDSLSVEIISARDVIPLDPNGLSDPFVIIELLPRRLFPNCSEQQTSVRRKNLNPVFDECFEFPVTLEQCRQETAMLLFTVMDYDVLTANDFAGEAFLSLNSVPGVAAGPQGLHDTFHGLKQIDLVLMHQTNKHPPILSVLESRVWDRSAQDFVRKQKDRIVN